MLEIDMCQLLRYENKIGCMVICLKVKRWRKHPRVEDF